MQHLKNIIDALADFFDVAEWYLIATIIGGIVVLVLLGLGYKF